MGDRRGAIQERHILSLCTPSLWVTHNYKVGKNILYLEGIPKSPFELQHEFYLEGIPKSPLRYGGVIRESMMELVNIFLNLQTTFVESRVLCAIQISGKPAPREGTRGRSLGNFPHPWFYHCSDSPG